MSQEVCCHYFNNGALKYLFWQMQHGHNWFTTLPVLPTYLSHTQVMSAVFRSPSGGARYPLSPLMEAQLVSTVVGEVLTTDLSSCNQVSGWVLPAYNRVNYLLTTGLTESLCSSCLTYWLCHAVHCWQVKAPEAHGLQWKDTASIEQKVWP